MNQIYIGVGAMLSMVFNKDKEEHIHQIVMKSIYADKAWVYYIASGNDELVDLADVSFAHPRVLSNPPDKSFVVKDPSDNSWAYWDGEEGFFYSCSDPTQIEMSYAKTQNAEGNSTLH